MKLEYVHNLRGLAILLIILAHSIAVLPSSNDVGYLKFLLMNSSILFVVISGFLFALIGERYTYKNYLVNKFKNVILPYLFLSLPAALIYILGYKTTHTWIEMDFFNQLPDLLKYAYLLVTGAHLGPLWFIPMMVIFYLCFPLFIFTLNMRKKYLILLFVLTLFLGLYLGRPSHNDNTMQSFLYFLSAYLWGIMLYRMPEIIQLFRKYSFLWLILFVSLTLFYYYIGGYDTHQDLPIKILLSTLLYSLFLHNYNCKVLLFSGLARVSFFLFFVHGYFAGAIRMYIKPDFFEINEYLLLTGGFMFILVATLISFYALRLFVGRYKRELLAFN